MNIYLIYNDLNGDGKPLYSCVSLDRAKQLVEEWSAIDMKYIKEHPERYRVLSPFVSQWISYKNIHVYEYTEERHVTLTGEWLARWGKYTIVLFELEE
jgi:hypothetical protein